MYHDVLDQFKPLQEKHELTIQAYLSWLKKTANINPEENQKTNQKLQEKLKIQSTNQKNKGWQIFYKVLIIVTLVAAVLFFAFSFYSLINDARDIWTWLLGFFCLGVFTVCILWLNQVNRTIIKLTSTIADLEKEIKKLKTVAWDQMRPLLNLLEDGVSASLMEKTFPLIDFDGYFDRGRLEFFSEKFGLPLIDSRFRSTLQVQSGNIIGNPFFLCKERIHYMGQKRYTGSIFIQWSTVAYVNGKPQRQYHSQTLTASVTKPFPLYDEQTFLLYGNDAAPDLSFSRIDSDAEHLNKDQLKNKINQGIKKLEQKSRESLKKGESFTVMGNSEFEVLWGAMNRNHEIQFRLLFTPLAQQELLKIMKEKNVGFGDNFNFIKEKKINKVVSEHMQSFDFKVPSAYFYHFNMDLFEKNFKDYQNRFFKNLYFTFAPLLAIPLYQQLKTVEYIYEDTFERGASFYEHERIANQWNIEDLKHPSSITQNILKTSLLNHRKNRDQIVIEAHGYKGVERTDIQTVLGGDGLFHSIPIRWIEYIPVVQKRLMEIEVAKKEGVSSSWTLSTQELKSRLSK